MRQLENTRRHFGSMGAKQAADERKEMSQLCESYACEHEEETETAEEDKQTFLIRILDKRQAEFTVIIEQLWLFQFQGHFSERYHNHTLKTSRILICNYSPKKSIQVRTLYLEMTTETLPYQKAFIFQPDMCVFS